MNPLVSKADLDEYKYIADSVRNSAVWEHFVVEAQRLDVKYWLGDALLSELLDQEEDSPESITALNETLMNGGKYTYQDKVYVFAGLKAVIIYYAFARFSSKSSYNFTQAGITVKDSDFSTPAPDKAIQRISTEALLTASSLKDEVVVYLRRNSSSYPLFKNCHTTDRARTFWVLGD